MWSDKLIRSEEANPSLSPAAKSAAVAAEAIVDNYRAE